MNIPNLMDPIRNNAYEWIIPQITKEKQTILDVGSRDSGFPTFLATLGHQVTSVERGDFRGQQEAWNARWRATTKHITGDLLSLAIPESGKYDILTAVYALQHNIEKDIDCYKKCAELANTIYIVNEFNYNESRFQYGRDDGDMRIYSMKDFEERIIQPISSVHTIKHMETYPCKFIFEKQSIAPCSLKEANTLGIKLEL